ncbi:MULTISPECIES: hypothetical protein [unclassified Legionella]|uniref:hypothetical protein n=1 Tax=unclassified Legionella TaxID=2622702 RepID=UPI0010568B1B|nr:MULTISPECIES: hypothetical protein [unclassified Legionella]MDI9817551.1 hypothetical protein [Legionella sp. PL877]
MKINDQLVPAANHTSVTNQTAENFLHWLEPGRAVTGDEYYWLNQQRLQCSALKFNPSDSKTKISPDSQSLTKEKKTRMPNTGLEDKQVSPNPVADAPLSKPDINHSVVIGNQGVNPLLTVRNQQKLQYLAFNQSLSISEIIKNKDSVKTAAPQVYQEAPLKFKNHQLFIKENQAELALNTTCLNSQESSQLTTLIKQWFVKKKIRLLQLIINGVKQ